MFKPQEPIVRGVQPTSRCVSAGILILTLALAMVASASTATRAGETPVRLSQWDRGIAIHAPEHPDMLMYLWFYEWNMFEAMQKGQHTQGTHRNQVDVSTDGLTGTIVSEPLGLALEARAGAGGVEMVLRATNRSNHAWPQPAAIIPCFNPGPSEIRNKDFINTNTFFLATDGLVRLLAREIHFNRKLRPDVDAQADREGKYVWSGKWPKSEIDAAGGLIVRESTSRRWVTGIAWERFLSAQGHNPWDCMHLSVNVGPLAQGGSREIRGKIYLFEGTREQLLERYRRDFAFR
jgi:hypothetical protein